MTGEGDRCDRCRTNDTECVFTQPKRARARVTARTQPYPQRRGSNAQNVHDYSRSVPTFAEYSDDPAAVPSESGYGRSELPLSPRADFEDNEQQQQEKPVVTNAIRARILKALATIKSKRGSPFSFVSSGDSPSFSTRDPNETQTPRDTSNSEDSSERLQATPSSLKLSRILRPLTNCANLEGDDDDWRPAGSVKMPSYLSSMTMGQTMTDPIDGGIVSSRASSALFEFFMVHMNAKWEYLLDPYTDTHSSIRKRSTLLFTSILFCASKFANFVDEEVKPFSDQFLQSRLCSVARNLVLKTLAEGDRSVETMQALYLLVCWKDADDDISYLHSGYAFRILHDLDLENGVCDGHGHGRQMARRKRTWLALFRQDRQQSLFFLRRASLSQADDDTSFMGDLDVWLKTPYSLPLDFVGCCSAHIRCIQSRIRHMVQKASAAMLPCLLELMDMELRSWRLKWNSHLEGEGRAKATAKADDQSSILPELLYPDREHLATLVAVWENSVRLNVSSAIFREALIASVSSSSSLDREYPLVNIDLSTPHEVLSRILPGLATSVESAFETLRHLMRFPASDLRRAPDAILLLAPNAALFLCLLLCLPGNGILGPAFQRTAVSLIRDIAEHIRLSVQSPQDIVALHSAYLESLVDLLDPSVSEQHSFAPHSALDTELGSGETRGDGDFDFSALQAAHVLADSAAKHGCDAEQNDPMLGIAYDPGQTLHMQNLANLLDGCFFWEMSSVSGMVSGDINIG